MPTIIPFLLSYNVYDVIIVFLQRDERTQPIGLKLYGIIKIIHFLCTYFLSMYIPRSFSSCIFQCMFISYILRIVLVVMKLFIIIYKCSPIYFILMYTISTTADEINFSTAIYSQIIKIILNKLYNS